MRVENLGVVVIALIVFGSVVGSQVQPMQSKVCPNPDCKCEENGGECFCAELWPDEGCVCKADPQPEPPKPAPFPPKPDPVPDVTPDEIDPPKPKPPKAAPEVTPEVTPEVIVHGDRAAFDAAYAEFGKRGWTVAWEDVPCVRGVCPQVRYTVEFNGKVVELKDRQTLESVRRALR